MKSGLEKYLLKEHPNSMKPFKKAVLGGTFDRLHSAHKKLLETAACLAQNVFIGIVGDALGKKLFPKKKHNELIQPFNVRKENVESFMKKFRCNVEIGELKDPWGPAPYDENADLIVVSEETKPAAEKINEMRKENNLPPLHIYVIEWIIDRDGKPISSTKLREKEAKSSS